MIRKVQSKERLSSKGGLLIIAFLSIFSDAQLAYGGDDNPKPTVASSNSKGQHPLDDRKSVPPFVIGDASSTAAALLSGAQLVEKNPLYSWSGNAAPLLVIPSYMIMKDLMIKSGADPARVNIQMNATGLMGYCNNLSAILGASMGFGVAVGISCALIYSDAATKDYIAQTGRNPIFPEKLHPSVRMVRASKIDEGRLAHGQSSVRFVDADVLLRAQR